MASAVDVENSSTPVVDISDSDDDSPTTSPAKKRPNKSENLPPCPAPGVNLYSGKAVQKLGQIVNDALFGEVDGSLISTVVPNHCHDRREATFLVDTSAFLCPDDVRVDQMGAYVRPSNDNSYWRKDDHDSKVFVRVDKNRKLDPMAAWDWKV